MTMQPAVPDVRLARLQLREPADELLVAVQEGRFHFAPALAEQEAMSKALTGYRRQVKEDGLIGSELVAVPPGDAPSAARLHYPD